MASDPAAAPGTQFSGDIASVALEAREEVWPGIDPYRLAWRRLRRNKVSLAFGGLFLLTVVLCLLAPVYSHDIAHTGPNDTHVTATVKVGGQIKNVVSPDGVPIGPTWQSHFLLGADNDGRDVAVRLLYGGRHAPPLGLPASLLTLGVAPQLVVPAGRF